MKVFDGTNKTPTRIDLSGDSFSPNMGALVGSSNTEDVLNHGTLNQLVQGNVTRVFCVNETITVSVNQTLTVGANRSATIGANDSLTLGANLTEMVGGIVNQTYGGGQITLCAGPHTRTDVASSVWMCPGGTFINSGDLYETKLTNCAAYLFQQQNVATAVDVFGLKSEVVVAKNKSEAIQTKLQNLSNKMVAGLRNTAQATCIAIHLMRSDMTGAHPEVRAVRPAVGCEISAPPSSIPGVQ
ncbi:MAG: hypothetical protein KatS3mg004_2405 [Bryobacteraceae bacterium]|nr:MAG: hypothetical protein KatS3mg004_2405 [Bryobacteraceae bacterium]